MRFSREKGKCAHPTSAGYKVLQKSSTLWKKMSTLNIAHKQVMRQHFSHQRLL